MKHAHSKQSVAVSVRPVSFNPWITSSRRVVEVIADNLLGHWERTEDHRRHAKRVDRKNRQAIAQTFVANLAYAAAVGANTIGISLRDARQASKQGTTRYDRPGFCGLPAALAAFCDGGTTTRLRRSRTKGIASEIVIDPTLADTFRRFRFGPEDFAAADDNRETIRLSRAGRDCEDDKGSRGLLPYADTPESLRYRDEMRRINVFLAHADIRMEPDGGPPIGLTQAARHVSRDFKQLQGNRNEFDLGGSLGGGFWQDLPKARRTALRIDGEPVASIELDSALLRLAYLAAGERAPRGDLYAVPGFEDPRWREGVRMATDALLLREVRLVALSREIEDALPPDAAARGIRARDFRSALLDAHPLTGTFEKGTGFMLAFTESRIIVAASLALLDQGVMALPLRSGVIVARSKADRATEAMSAAAERIAEAKLPITVD